MTLPGDAGAAPSIVRDAATIILLRHHRDAAPEVLMGQRGAAAAFMPDKFVFPGGALDPADIALSRVLGNDIPVAPELCIDAVPDIARALPLAAIRELWEETGLRLGQPDGSATALAPQAPEPWQAFLAAGLRPGTGALRFVFRAVTPPGRPRRFDARFFLADVADIVGDPSDFADASDELRHLQWLDLTAARALSLPFITEVVLSEIEAMVRAPNGSRPVPFFNHVSQGSQFRLL